MNPLQKIFNRRARDAPKTSVGGGYVFRFGNTPSGKIVNERTSMACTAVYACGMTRS